MKKKFFIYVLAAIVSLAIAWLVATTVTPKVAAKSDPEYPRQGIVLGGKSFTALVANTDLLRDKGLGDRDGLADGQAMLFTFDRDDLYAFWMKDMRFSIDMLWLDHDLDVVWVEKNVSPDSYPHVYTPAKPARYVLETNAGELEALHIKVGDKAAFFSVEK